MLPYPTFWAKLVVAVGEVLVGLGLIFGALTAVAVFFGTVMSASAAFTVTGAPQTPVPVPTPAPVPGPTQPAPPIVHDDRYFSQTGYRRIVPG